MSSKSHWHRETDDSFNILMGVPSNNLELALQEWRAEYGAEGLQYNNFYEED